MFRIILTTLPTLAWLVAAATMMWLVQAILSTPDNNGPLEYALLATALTGAAMCLIAAYRELKNAYYAKTKGTSFWIPDAPESQLIGAEAGNRYPMTRAQIERVRKFIAALTNADLIPENNDGHIGLIQMMEHEGYGKDITAADTLLSLRSSALESGLELESMVFTDEGVEVHDDQLYDLTHELLTLAGHTGNNAEIFIERQPSTHGKGQIRFKLNNIEHHIACEFHDKFTPTGLLEGIAAHAADGPGKHLYWENLDSSILIVRLAPEAASTLNTTMEDLGDSLRFYTFDPAKFIHTT